MRSHISPIIAPSISNEDEIDQKADHIGVITFIADRGFGFARNLTGDRSRDVFINENRIAQLRITSTRSRAMLVRMRIAVQADGRISASRVAWLDLTSSSTNALARHHLASTLGVAQAEEAPAPLLQLLWGADPAVDDLLRPVFAALPEGAWRSPFLLCAIEHCPPSSWKRVFPHHLSSTPARALAVLQKEVARDPERYCPSTWLNQLWDALPMQRGEVLAVALTASRGLTPQKSARWARNALDHYSGATAPLARSATRGWWNVLQTAVANGASLDASWQTWAGWEHAPWSVAKLALAQLKWESAAEALQAIAALEDAQYQSASIGRMPAIVQLAALDDRDQQLADTWTHHMADQTNAEQLNAVRAQMRTARAAEICASVYFRALGLSVEDVAIEQLAGSSDDWSHMDLRIDGRHGVDVKNLRRTINGGSHSSRWKVKDFKRDSAGTDVMLCGVSSPHTYFLNGTLTCDATEDMRVLGVTTALEARSLSRRFTSIFSLRLNPVSKLIELPAWAWDYPRAQYRERDRLMASVRDAMMSLQSTVIGRRRLITVPAVLFSFWNLEPPSNDAFTPQQRHFLHQMRAALSREHDGRTASSFPRLPWIYLFVLHFWASWRATNESSDSHSLLRLFQWHAHSSTDARQASEDALRHLISLGASDEHDLPEPFHTPMRSIVSASDVSGCGVVDPANTISTLLNALTALEAKLSMDQFVSLTDINHSLSGVLVGTFPDGQRKTLLAHCCGRLSNGVECGNRPLVFGRHLTCACGRLICNRCSTCTDTRYAYCDQQTARVAQREKLLSGSDYQRRRK